MFLCDPCVHTLHSYLTVELMRTGGLTPDRGRSRSYLSDRLSSIQILMGPSLPRRKTVLLVRILNKYKLKRI